jgi:hypothetical protein
MDHTSEHVQHLAVAALAGVSTFCFGHAATPCQDRLPLRHTRLLRARAHQGHQALRQPAGRVAGRVCSRSRVVHAHVAMLLGGGSPSTTPSARLRAAHGG